VAVVVGKRRGGMEMEGEECECGVIGFFFSSPAAALAPNPPCSATGRRCCICRWPGWTHRRSGCRARTPPAEEDDEEGVRTEEMRERGNKQTSGRKHCGQTPSLSEVRKAKKQKPRSHCCTDTCRAGAHARAEGVPYEQTVTWGIHVCAPEATRCVCLNILQSQRRVGSFVFLSVTFFQFFCLFFSSGVETIPCDTPERRGTERRFRCWREKEPLRLGRVLCGSERSRRDVTAAFPTSNGSLVSSFFLLSAKSSHQPIPCVLQQCPPFFPNGKYQMPV
jgi:hypothetical protein